MVMKELHLHIGRHKTGSSTLQHFLSINAEALRSDGFYYPKNPAYFWQGEHSHSFLAHSFKTERPHYLPSHATYEAEHAWQSLYDDVAQRAGEKLLLSSEHFCSLNTAASVSQLADRLAPLIDVSQIYVYCYVRRQDELFESEYKENIKSGDHSSTVHERLFDRLSEKPNAYDYYDFLSVWEQCFDADKVTLVPFERGQLHNASIIDDFMNRLSLFDLSSYRRISDQNLAMPAELLELLRIISPSVNKEQYRVLRSWLTNHVNSFDRRPVTLLTDNMRKVIFERYKEQNLLVAKNKLGRKDGVLFKDEIAEKPVFRGLSTERTASLMSQIILSDVNRLAKLQRKIADIKT